MSSIDDLLPVLKTLRLSGLLETLDARTDQAVDEALPHSEFLYRPLNDEVERRMAKRLTTRLHNANFEGHKAFEDFDFRFNPKIPRDKLIELSSCSFIERRENVLLIGPSGVGKSHIAQALGQRACRANFRTLFVPAHVMLSGLRAARADQTWDKMMAKLTSVDLLIIDDLGLRPLSVDEPVDLYEIIRRRYEHGSMIITSNRDVSEWYPMFDDPLLASSAMDRLLHYGHTIVMDGDSYRNPPKKRRSKTA